MLGIHMIAQARGEWVLLIGSSNYPVSIAYESEMTISCFNAEHDRQHQKRPQVSRDVSH